jgi:hypothetical protein
VNEGAYNAFNPDTFSLSKLGGKTLTIKCAASNACGTMVSGDSAMLTVNKSEYNTIDSTVCDSVLWHGTVYAKSGTYTFDTLTAKGCPRMDTLKLTVNKS